MTTVSTYKNTKYKLVFPPQVQITLFFGVHKVRLAVKNSRNKKFKKRKFTYIQGKLLYYSTPTYSQVKFGFWSKGKASFFDGRFFFRIIRFPVVFPFHLIV